jgi:Zn-dependent protease
MNFFQQGIPLGRWFRITVVIHWTFLIYAAWNLYGVASQGWQISFEILYLALLFGTVLVHEFGHALSCLAVGGEAHHIVLWPLGGIAFVQPPPKPWAWLVTTVCGPLVNAILWPLFWFLFTYWAMPRFETNPTEINRWVAIACEKMWGINQGLLLFNLIPAYPMDGGRIVQEVLWMIIGYGRSMMVAGMIGTAAGVAFIVLGLGLQEVHIPFVDFQLGVKGKVNTILAVIGLMCAMESFALYRRSQEVASWRKNRPRRKIDVHDGAHESGGRGGVSFHKSHFTAP